MGMASIPPKTFLARLARNASSNVARTGEGAPPLLEEASCAHVPESIATAETKERVCTAAAADPQSLPSQPSAQAHEKLAEPPPLLR